MKRTSLHTLLVLVAFSSLMLSACRKKATVSDDVYSAQDYNTGTQQLTAVMDDAANAAGGVAALSGKTNSLYMLEGASIDSSQRSNGIIKITYDGTTVVDNYFKRSGTVTLTLENFTQGTRWRDAGAVLDADFDALVVTNVLTGDHLQYDGLNKLTNVSGGLAWRILYGDNGSVIHRHTASSVRVTFADGSQRTWSVDRSRTYTRSGSDLSLTLTGGATQGGYSNVDMWGTNRNGVSFINQISTPIVFENSCSNYRNATSGVITHYVNGNTLIVTLGVNAAGTPATVCPYGYKIVYTTANNRVYSTVVQYWH